MFSRVVVFICFLGRFFLKGCFFSSFVFQRVVFFMVVFLKGFSFFEGCCFLGSFF